MDPGVSVATEGNSPRHQLGLGSTHDLHWNLRLNFDVRYVGKLTSLPVDGYLTADARVAWRPHADVEFAVVGRNLVGERHQEFTADFSGGRSLTKVERSVYGVLTWSVEP
jgi:iron complex outermembrane receptor protein